MWADLEEDLEVAYPILGNRIGLTQLDWNTETSRRRLCLLRRGTRAIKTLFLWRNPRKYLLLSVSVLFFSTNDQMLELFIHLFQETNFL